MTKKTNINININGVIIKFFRGLSTYPFENGYGPLKTEANSIYYIYRANNYQESLQKLAVMFLNNNIRDIEQLDYVKNLIDNWLCSALSDERLFNLKKLMPNCETYKKNLFENRSIYDIEVFCNEFKAEIDKIMLDVIKNRFLIFPVRNFFKDNFSFGLMGYINNNKCIKNQMSQHFTQDCVDIVVDTLLNEIDNNKIFEKADGFIYIRSYVGDNFLSKSEHDIKFFTTVCLSTIKEKPSSISICLLDQFQISALLDDFKTIYYREFRNPILPSIADNQIESFNFDEVDIWYETFNQLEFDKKERIDRCIYLINNAFCNKKYKKFIDICQGIDALFGVNKKVTESIKENLKNIIIKYNGNLIFIEKIDKLWRLRNSLVHGSIKDIRDSRIYLEYQLKYLRCPEDDYLDLSLFCIKHSVHYFHSGSFLDFKTNDSKLKAYLKKKMKELNDWFQST